MLEVFQRVLAGFYAYGAIIHLVNLLGRGPTIPADRVVVFRALDVIFLVLDLIVVVGLWRHALWGVIAFFLAAGAQVIMYLGFTDYFAADLAQRRQLFGLVAFHVATMALMSGLIWARSRS